MHSRSSPIFRSRSSRLHFNGGKGGLLTTALNLCTAPPQRFQDSFDGFNGAHTQGP